MITLNGNEVKTFPFQEAFLGHPVQPRQRSTRASPQSELLPGRKRPDRMGDDLKVIHFNTQGFHNKVDDINGFVRTHKPDVLVLTEHFQKNRDDLERIDGYRIVNSFCRRHKERGGVAIFARHGLPCSPRRDLDRHRRERELELVSVSVGVGEDVVVTGAYRPPDTRLADFHDHLLRVVRKINEEPHIKHVLAGDFNVDNSKPNSTRTVLGDHDLKFHLTSRTHRAGRCIDNFITNFEAPEVRVLKTRGDFSDHQPIEILVPKEAESISKTPNSYLFKSLLKLFWDDSDKMREQYESSGKVHESEPRKKSLRRNKDPKFYKMFMKMLAKQYKSRSKEKRSRSWKNNKSRRPFMEPKSRLPLRELTPGSSRSRYLKQVNDNFNQVEEQDFPKVEPQPKSLLYRILSFFKLEWLISSDTTNSSPTTHANHVDGSHQITPSDSGNIFVKIYNFLYNILSYIT